MPAAIMEARADASIVADPPVCSPLTGSTDVTLLRRIPCEELIAAWQAQYGFDITSELRGRRELLLYECNRTGLRFFTPADVEGSGALYAGLEQFDWYYMPRKWEHDVALRDLPPGGRILEVGCGRGAFVARLLHEHGCQTSGLELNPRAVAAAGAAGLPVVAADVRAYAAEHADEFDAVCSFQVLEHVADVRGFLSALARLVRPGGRLILAVPNHDSFLGAARDLLLDEPPHHMTQWRACVFACLPTLLPLRLVRLVCEPLAAYHVDMYLHVRADRTRGGPLARHAQKRLLREVARPLLLHCAPARRWIRGHTLYACFAKRGVPREPRGARR